MIDPELSQRVRRAAERIAPLSERIEADRRLPAEAVQALVDAGLFKLAVPRTLGGLEATPRAYASALETIAHADGSAGWCAMIGATTGLVASLVPEAFAREVFAPADAVACGVFAPMGKATRDGEGFRVSGRWSFASGCEHSQWRMGGVIVTSDPPDLLPNGAPHVRSVLFRADETRVIDTWNTSGLRGTGSHDIEVKDVWVPSTRVFSLVAGEPWPRGPLYRAPFFGYLATGVAAVAIGIAQRALDDVMALAQTKQSVGAKRGIAHRELVQLSIADAAAKINAARAGLHRAWADVEDELGADGSARASLRARAMVRAAACHATSEAAAAVDLAYEVGGGASIYASSPLQRAFRDVHTATQHVMVTKTAAQLAGRVLLGLDADTSVL